MEIKKKRFIKVILHAPHIHVYTMFSMLLMLLFSFSFFPSNKSIRKAVKEKHEVVELP